MVDYCGEGKPNRKIEDLALQLLHPTDKRIWERKPIDEPGSK